MRLSPVLFLVLSPARSFAPLSLHDNLRSSTGHYNRCSCRQPHRRAVREEVLIELPQNATLGVPQQPPPRARVWQRIWQRLCDEPGQALTIPLTAALVGWITNKVGVEMLFWPLNWCGIPLWVVPNQPLGLLGWQGIVPAKAGVMAARLVDMVTTQLIDVSEVFKRLDPHRVARLLGPEVNKMAEAVATDLLPASLDWLPTAAATGLPAETAEALINLRQGMLVGLTKDLQKHIHTVLDLKELVVGEMTRDRRVMVELFRRCGREEFKFLVDSGFYFGFLLGIIQMVAWLAFPKPWTMPVGGAIVGYLTNWLALELIFKPREPVRIRKFMIQGLFLQRQLAVSTEFSDFLVASVLTSVQFWKVMLTGAKAPLFDELLTRHVKPFILQASAILGAPLDTVTAAGLTAKIAAKLPDHVHVLHAYTDKTLQLKETMAMQMRRMSPKDFESVLHPIFQEDEFTLVLVGALLGALAGWGQMVLAAPIANAVGAAGNAVTRMGAKMYKVLRGLLRLEQRRNTRENK